MSLQSPPNIQKQNPSVDLNGSKPVDFFDTSHLKTDIQGRSVRGGTVTMTAQGAKFILNIGSSAALARLLTKEDFGLIAMVAFFTEFVNLFKDLGLSMSTIQKKDITHEQVSNLFWINIAMSCLLMLIAAVISPFVAKFYSEPRLTYITIAIGCTFIFGGLIAQHTALMRRQMRFRILAVIEVVSMAAGILAAIAAALYGLKYWSLVIMTFVRGIVSVIMVWSQSSWRPGKPSRNSGIRPMLALGGSLTATTILNYFTRHTDNAVIGYALGPSFLGIYTKAYSLLTLPMSQFNAPLHSVMMPALSRLQDEPKQYRHFFLQVFTAVSMFSLPLVAFLLVSADEVVDILLGSKWSDVAPTFRYLGPAAFFSAISFSQGWLFISLGRAGMAFIWNLIAAPIIIISFLYGVIWGINGIAAGFSITYSILMVIGLAVACHKSPVHFYDIVKALAVPVMSSLLAALAAFLTGRFISGFNVFIRFAVYALVFAICYLACVMATSAGRQSIRSIIKAFLSLGGGKPSEKVV